MHMSGEQETLELWGGVEGTVNRVGDDYFDQFEWSGHLQRLDDLDRIAALGIRTVRYPLVWERIAPDSLANADWSWADARMERFKVLGMQPIVGLLHHGSGPRDTSLLDPAFPEKLALYARAVAERYPWVCCYTPVNEPLTTARFSGLYGHWYPHGTDNATFLRALINETRATVLAMEAIKIVRPDAQLIQTEDLSKTHSTPSLEYQARFENERRWLSLDLLCGRIDATHPMSSYLHKAGISATELQWFQEHPCPPDIMGFNYYVTSERLIDERIERYPAWSHGGNERHTYADVEAIRVVTPGTAGFDGLLREAHERYGIPLAITEAHLGGPRDEQLRWLLDSWRGAEALRAEGIDVRAVTIWALFGSFDWNHLVTQPVGFYEPGAFDVRAEPPRPTALAHLAHQLATGETPDHPVLATPGWWRRDDRFAHPPVAIDVKPLPTWPDTEPPHPLLITDATSIVGQAFVRVCEQRGLAYHALSYQELDIADGDAITAALATHTPWAVISVATSDDGDRDAAEPAIVPRSREHADGVEQLAVICAANKIALLTFSADRFFADQASLPRAESDMTAPFNGSDTMTRRTESRVIAAYPEALVARTNPFFRSCDTHTLVPQMLHAWSRHRPRAVAESNVVTPADIEAMAQTCLDLLIDGESGIWDLVKDGALSRDDLARRLAKYTGNANILSDATTIAQRAAASVFANRM